MMLGLTWIAVAASVAAETGRDAPANPQESAVELPANDILVTGERVPRSLKGTAPSVVAVTRADIEAQPVDRVEQVLAFIPNVQVGHGSEGPAIRGLDTTGALQALPAFLGGNRPRTTVVVDGRPTTYNEFVFGAQPTWDVERIEIFRSPQTTTQGQNSIAGAIFVYTADPDFTSEYRARGILGDYRTRQLSAVASGPVADDVAVRVAGDLRYSRTTSEIADRAEGANPNHDVYGLVRAKLLVTASPNTRLALTYAHQQSQAPQVVQVTEPFEERRDAGGFYGTFRINVDSVTAAVRHEAGDFAANAVVTGGDSLAERLAFPGLGQARIDGRDWSAEAVVNWAPEGPVGAVAGVARTHLVLRQFIDLSAIGAIGRFYDSQDGTGIFGEVSAEVMPRATLTVGIRHQEDRQDRSGDLATGAGSIPLEFDRTFRAWLPKLSLAYDFSASVRAGLMVQRAYNPGGTTLRFDIARPDNFKAETLWDYELFARAELGRGVIASANLFHYDMRNAQRAKEIVIPGPGGGNVGFADMFNVPQARSYGLEAELGWRPSGSLSARLSVGLLRTRIVEASKEYPEYEGNQFGRSPLLSAAAAVDWRVRPRLRLSAQVRHHSRYFSDDANNGAALVPAATIADARAEYRLRRFTLFAHARNLFDRFAFVQRDADSAVLEEPREVAVGIETGF